MFSLLDCFPGYFGNECEQKCSGHCLKNKTCDRIDGTCSDGCEDGYIGKLCNDCKAVYHCVICIIAVINYKIKMLISFS